eukprot:TCALIF_07163-PA protein Name:"Similar to cep152 Centrosomal protein of 152 kDa (Xenopus laevis)" AED:0.03 eAED:0.03 QI:0/0.85/0.75/0.87/1/1/8/105/677
MGKFRSLTGDSVEDETTKDPGLSVYPLNPTTEQIHEDQALEEQEEEHRLEQEIAKKLEGAFDDIELDLEEDESFMDEGHSDSKTPRHEGQPSRVPEHFLTSTPYIRGGIDLEGGTLEADTPQREDTPRNEGDSGHFRVQQTANNEQLEVLYLARGHEIDRLKHEIESLRGENGGENRRLKHELALLRADNERVNVQLEQSQHAYQSTADDNRALRSEIDALKGNVLKQEKSKEELIAHSEASDHMIQTLQQQLIDLQRKDTVLKAREHHDAIVSSLKERHENEVFNLEQEVDRLNAQLKRYENEMDSLRGKMNETQRQHESMLIEKSERIEDLSHRLAETQKKLTQVIVANSTHDMESRIGDPLKEIVDLKTKLGSITQQRHEQDKHIHDLMDEISELQKQLQDSQGKAHSSAKDQLYELRLELNAKDEMVVELKRRERDLIRQCEKMKEDMLTIQQKLREVDRESLKTKETIDRNVERELDFFKDENHRKNDLLQKQEERIENLVSHWEIEITKIRANHGKDRRELEEVSKKYINLKKKVIHYQKHVKNKEAHYMNEIDRLRETFQNTLLNYKSKLDGAYQSREKKIEDELQTLKDNFESELHRLVQDDLVEGPLSMDLHPNPMKHSHQSSDEENRPRKHLTTSSQMAKIFAEATRDAKEQLKKPSERLPLFQQNH